MCLKLVLAENRPQLFKIWLDKFTNIQGLIVLNGTAYDLFEAQGIDAELMRGIFAHERYGGKQKVGESQILSTKGEVGMPPWVVTTAPFPAHIEKRQKSNGSFQIEIVKDNELAPEEEFYILFCKAFESIEKFNLENKKNEINTLGIDLEFLDFPHRDPHQEANAVIRAYSKYYNQGCKSSEVNFNSSRDCY